MSGNGERERQLESFRIFNEQGGKFRVSVVNHCNLNCFFCHNEGMENPRDRGKGPVKGDEIGPEALDADEVLKLINAYTGLGGKLLNITGGDSLLHPNIIEILENVEKNDSYLMLNTNAILADLLLDRPPIKNVDAVFASIHTTQDDTFRNHLGGRSAGDALDGILALKNHGYTVLTNTSVGSHNADDLANILDFTMGNGICCKFIAVIRAKENPGVYEEGNWVGPTTMDDHIKKIGGVKLRTRDALGGRSTDYQVGEYSVTVKNVAAGRLFTDFCDGCDLIDMCGEGIYGLRVGVDGLWKPCLLNPEKRKPVLKDESRESQILSIVDSMIGHWPNARYVAGAPQ